MFLCGYILLLLLFIIYEKTSYLFYTGNCVGNSVFTNFLVIYFNCFTNYNYRPFVYKVKVLVSSKYVVVDMWTGQQPRNCMVYK